MPVQFSLGFHIQRPREYQRGMIFSKSCHLTANKRVADTYYKTNKTKKPFGFKH